MSADASFRISRSTPAPAQPAVVAGATLPHFDELDDPAEAEKPITEGLGLTQTVVAPHVDNEEFGAGLPEGRGPARACTHTLRHAFITAALDAGVPLRDVQEAASHADPRTTMRYDRARGSLDRHATYIVATYLAGATR